MFTRKNTEAFLKKRDAQRAKEQPKKTETPTSKSPWRRQDMTTKPVKGRRKKAVGE